MRAYRVLGLIGAVVIVFTIQVQAQEDFCQQRQFYTLGDLNSDSIIDLGDIIYLAQYIFRNGPAPLPDMRSGDVNLDKKITLGDIIGIVNVWVGRSGGILRLEYQNYCCNRTRCGYPCTESMCQQVYPLAGAKVRVFRNDTLISENFSDSSGSVIFILPNGYYDFVAYPPHDDIDYSLHVIVDTPARIDLGTQISLDSWVDQEVLLVYDTTYSWDRLQQIFDSIGVVSWEHFIPNHPEFIVAIVPSCLHVSEAVEYLNQHMEIIGASPNGFGCLDSN